MSEQASVRIQRGGIALAFVIALLSAFQRATGFDADDWLASFAALGFLGLLSTPAVRSRIGQLAKPALLALALTSVALQAFSWTGERLAPSVLLLPLFGGLATLLCGFWAGHAAFMASLLIHVSYCLLRPTANSAEQAVRSNLGLTLLALHLFVIGYGLTFRQLRLRLEAQRKELTGRLQERARLIGALQFDFDRALAQLADKLAQPIASRQQLLASQERLERILLGARAGLKPHPQPMLRPLDCVVPDFRMRMSRWLIGLMTLELAALWLLIELRGRGALLEVQVMLLVHCALFALLLLRPSLRVAIVSLSTFLWLAMFVSATVGYWGVAQPAPSLVFLPTLAYSAVLLGGRRTVLALAALLLGLVIYFWTEASSNTLWAELFFTNLAVATLATQVAWYLFEDQVAGILLALQEQTRELGRLERFRTRICGTLFHDVANPVQAMGMILTIAAPRPALSSAELALFARLEERLRDLIGATMRVLDEAGPLRQSELVATPLECVLQGVEELFFGRLHDKQLRVLRARTELCVWAVPELLRDSVLANLLSNAIKFSPRGACVEIMTRRAGSLVEIAVADQGPGYPPDLPARLAHGEKLASTRGTAGEQGLGLGLLLAAEHAQRMGGKLELGWAPAGGSRAVVLLAHCEERSPRNVGAA